MTSVRTTKNTDPHTDSITIYTDIADSTKAGMYVADQIRTGLKNKPADAVIIFASSKYNYDELLGVVQKHAAPVLLVGCSSAGEFTNNKQGEGSVSAIALRSNEMQFAVGLGKNISKNVYQAAKEVVDSFQGTKDLSYKYRSALVLADALAGYTDSLIDEMNRLTAGTYQFFGGGAGDDAQFNTTHVFRGNKALTNAVVALEILSNKPIGIGVRHGWKPTGESMRVTESEGMKLISLNAVPAIEMFVKHAESTGQSLDLKNPTSFFLHNVIGIKTTQGYQLRVPLTIDESGAINCASDIPTGSLISFMKTTAASAASAAQEATEDALVQLDGRQSNTALVFDCVATRLRTGGKFKNELQAVADKIPGTSFVGCNTYGQVSRVDGQFNGFHNCTAVVCIFPK